MKWSLDHIALFKLISISTNFDVETKVIEKQFLFDQNIIIKDVIDEFEDMTGKA